jgi:hypothetical protein
MEKTCFRIPDRERPHRTLSRIFDAIGPLEKRSGGEPVNQLLEKRGAAKFKRDRHVFYGRPLRADVKKPADERRGFRGRGGGVVTNHQPPALPMQNEMWGPAEPYRSLTRSPA